jgi:hypothetical protein
MFKRQIHDAVSLYQEALHSIKTQKIPSIVLNLTSPNPMTKFSWVFLRLALIQMGMNLEMVNWIMGCIESASFIVLINGSPSQSFCSLRGLRQGCPLSLFLFLIVVEGLSKLIQNAKRSGILKGIKIYESEILSHILFIDDVMLFGAGS